MKIQICPGIREKVLHNHVPLSGLKHATFFYNLLKDKQIQKKNLSPGKSITWNERLRSYQFGALMNQNKK